MKRLHYKNAYPVTTCFKNLMDLSTTSNQTGETFVCSKRVAIGNSLRASRDSFKSSLHRSISSPNLQALLKKANEKFNAALDPT